MSEEKKKRRIDFGALDLSQFDLTRKYDEIPTDEDDISLRDHVLLIVIAFIFLVFILWANFATLDEVTRGEGKVIPSSETQMVQNLEGGIVDEFLVKEGDVVKAGQTVIRMRNVAATADYKSNLARYLGIKAAILRLEAIAEGKDLVFPEDIIAGAPESVKSEMDSYKANLKQADDQINVLEQQAEQKKQEVTELETRIKDLNSVIALAKEEKAMIEPMVARGAASKMELLQLDRSMAERRTELNGVKLALERARTAVNEADSRVEEVRSTLKADARRELSERTVELNAIREGLASLEDRKSRTDVKAPADGTVKDLLVTTVGAVVQPGQTLMEIVPLNDQLLVEAKVRPSDIAFVYPTQKAKVKITAYDYSIYGDLEGKVTDISADTITDEDGESFYRVRVLTNETTLEHKGEVLQVIPGMTAGVDILTGEKTVMQYLIKPFTKAARNAMQER